MDPLAITCAVLACIQAAKASFVITQAVLKAPREVQDLQQELDELEELVDDVSQTLRGSPGDASNRYGKILQRPLLGLKKDVEHLNSYLNTKFKDCSAFQRIVWAKERSHMKGFIEKLNRRKLNTLLAISAAGMYVAPTMHSGAHRSSPLQITNCPAGSISQRHLHVFTSNHAVLEDDGSAQRARSPKSAASRPQPQQEPSNSQS